MGGILVEMVYKLHPVCMVCCGRGGVSQDVSSVVCVVVSVCSNGTSYDCIVQVKPRSDAPRMKLSIYRESK